ncbi:uncharacterized protein LOC143298590 [Babylonia areolata]|uniref:uncharacterized protein LOC143298590 n=1 Tax=Babylonia areolata TaxID=304850 RepID=UPI003FD191F5
MSGYVSFLAACCFAVVLSDATIMGLPPTLWTKVAQRNVTSKWTPVPAVSRIHCMHQCQQTEGCDSAAFDSASSVCYLRPDTDRNHINRDVGPTLDVFTIKGALQCDVSDAPAISNASVGNWRVTSSSLQGDVSCDKNYLLSAAVTPSVSCELETGVWDSDMPANVTCMRFAWRNYTAQPGDMFPLPRPASVGWCVQLRAIPTDVSFAVNLIKNDVDYVLHANSRFKYLGYENTTLLVCVQNGTTIKRTTLTAPSSPFPFEMHVPFKMTITMVSPFGLQVSVNGRHYGNFTGVIPVNETKKVGVVGGFTIDYISLKCYE